LARIPHKSIWKERKKEPEEEVIEKKKEESIIISDELRAKLNKAKRYVMILCIILIAPVIVSFIYAPVLFILPFIILIAVFIGVFMVYFPITDMLKRPEK